MFFFFFFFFFFFWGGVLLLLLFLCNLPQSKKMLYFSANMCIPPGSGLGTKTHIKKKKKKKSSHDLVSTKQANYFISKLCLLMSNCFQ